MFSNLFILRRLGSYNERTKGAKNDFLHLKKYQRPIWMVFGYYLVLYWANKNFTEEFKSKQHNIINRVKTITVRRVKFGICTGEVGEKTEVEKLPIEN